MPWKECKPMDERLKFIARLLEGEKMAPVCREFGISRVTGYKIFNRYREVADQVWLVSFMDYDLGFFDNEQGRVEPTLNPFTPEKVLTMSPE